MMNPVFQKPQLPLLVYTDLDGTLLDHDSYSFAAALPALQRLAELGIPVIPVTSKTLAELEPLTRELQLQGPRIAENGGLIAYPAGYFRDQATWKTIGSYQVQRLSPSYPRIVATLAQLREKSAYRFEGFSDLSTHRICELTGLTQAQAVLAKQRLCSEPLVWHGSDDALKSFSADLAQHRYTLVRGGRFWHVMGQTDKAGAIQELNGHFEQAGLHNATHIALGDSPNDIPMLLATDVAVVIRRKDGSHLTLEGASNIFKTDATGPQGWNEFFQDYLDNRDPASDSDHA